MLFAAKLGMDAGDPERLTLATDYKAQVCGSKSETNTVPGEHPTGDLTGLSVGYYPRLEQDFIDSKGKVEDMKLYTVCLADCPAMGDWVCNYEAEAKMETLALANIVDDSKTKRHAHLNGCATFSKTGEDCMYEGGMLPYQGCWFVSLESQKALGRCLPQVQRNQTKTYDCADPITDPVTEFDDPNCKLIETTIYTTEIKSSKENPLMAQLQGVAQTISNVFADVKKTQDVIFRVGVGLAIGLGFVWLGFLSVAAGCMVWSVVFGILALCGAASYFAMEKAAVFPFPDQVQADVKQHEIDTKAVVDPTTNPLEPELAAAFEEKQNFEKIAYAVQAVSLVILFMIIAMRKNIHIAVGILKEASKACKRMKLICLYPIISVVLLIGLLSYWLAVAALLASAKNIELPDDAAEAMDTVAAPAAGAANGTVTLYSGPVPVAKAEDNALARNLMWYHFFGLLWTNQVIQGLGMVTLGGAFSSFYFAKDKAADLGKTPVLSAWIRAVRFHFGSICFGGLIIAIVQFVRAVIAYVEKNFAHLKEKSKLVAIFFKIIGCFLWCLEKCLKFISKNAYIIVATKGKSFCPATKEAFGLIWANLARMAIVTAISGLIILLCRLTITIACGVVMFFMLQDPQYKLGGAKELSSTAAPIVLTTGLAYFVSSAFMSVYAMGCDTILLCICMDEGMKKKNASHVLSAPEGLLKYLDSAGGAKKDDGGGEADA